MKPGRKKIPRHLKIVQGNPGGRPLPEEPEAPPVRSVTPPKPPAYFTRDAVFEWGRRYKQLAAMGMLSEADLTALKLYCVAYGRFCKAERKIKTDGEIVETPNGYPQQSPWLSISNKAFEQMRKLGAEFGFTPSSRSGLEVPPTPPPRGGGSAPAKPPLS